MYTPKGNANLSNEEISYEISKVIKNEKESISDELTSENKNYIYTNLTEESLGYVKEIIQNINSHKD